MFCGPFYRKTHHMGTVEEYSTDDEKCSCSHWEISCWSSSTVNICQGSSSIDLMIRTIAKLIMTLILNLLYTLCGVFFNNNNNNKEFSDFTRLAVLSWHWGRAALSRFTRSSSYFIGPDSVETMRLEAMNTQCKFRTVEARLPWLKFHRCCPTNLFVFFVGV